MFTIRTLSKTPIDVKTTAVGIEGPVALVRDSGDTVGTVSADGRTLTFAPGADGESRFRASGNVRGSRVEDEIVVAAGEYTQPSRLGLVVDEAAVVTAPEPVREVIVERTEDRPTRHTHVAEPKHVAHKKH